MKKLILTLGTLSTPLILIPTLSSATTTNESTPKSTNQNEQSIPTIQEVNAFLTSKLNLKHPSDDSENLKVLYTGQNVYASFDMKNGYTIVLLSVSFDEFGYTDSNTSDPKGSLLIYYQLIKDNKAVTNIESTIIKGFVKSNSDNYNAPLHSFDWLANYLNYTLNPIKNPLYQNLYNTSSSILNAAYLALTKSDYNKDKNEMILLAKNLYFTWTTLDATKNILDELQSENVELKPSYQKQPIDIIYNALVKYDGTTNSIVKSFMDSLILPKNTYFNLKNVKRVDNNLIVEYTLSPANEKNTSESQVLDIHTLTKTITIPEDVSSSITKLENNIKESQATINALKNKDNSSQNTVSKTDQSVIVKTANLEWILGFIALTLIYVILFAVFYKYTYNKRAKNAKKD